MSFNRGVLLAAFAAAGQAVFAASLVCTPAAAPVVVRAEGLAEPIGDIVLACRNGPPSGTVTGSLAVSLPVNITNRLSAGNVIDAVLTVDTGSGPVSAGATTILTGASSAAFTDVSFTLAPAGTASLRISNLRGAMTQLGAGAAPLRATLSWMAGNTDVFFDSPSVTVAVPRTGLFAATVSALANCTGSPLPQAITVPALFGAQTRLSSTRLSEGFTNAFEQRGAGSDTGTRFLLSYSGFPAGARLFVPDAVAGSGAAQPTSSGLMGRSAAVGAYTTASHTLLLVRIDRPTAAGTGGTPRYLPPVSGTASLIGASEVTLVNGAGQAVYEVVDANASSPESVEIPTWLGLAPTGGAASNPKQSVMFAPVSESATAAAAAPVPRFAAVEPESDCALQGDCGSFPKLVVTAPALEYTAESGAARIATWISAGNSGGGTLAWTAYVTYTSGEGWTRLAFTSGAGGIGRVQLSVLPESLDPGIYEATLTIDAGIAGLQNLPVKLTVTPPSTPLGPKVNAVLHGATFAHGAFAPGSLISIMGLRLGGAAVAVTFDSLNARLLYTGDKQINLEVPATLAGKTLTRMIVTVDGTSTPAVMVDLTPIAPGIFANGILNQDNSRNSEQVPAAGGSAIQVFATGLPSSEIGTVVAKIHDVWITSPEYAGPAPGLVGVQQVNLRVPEGWPAMNTSVVVCATRLTTGVRTCSPQAPLSVK